MARFDLGIGKITVEKETLLTILRANEQKHGKTYRAACRAWRERGILELDALLQEVKDGRKQPCWLGVGLPVPEEHTADYQRAIRMLELHVGKQVELTEEAYRKLVDDQWEWTRSFIENTANYISEE